METGSSHTPVRHGEWAQTRLGPLRPVGVGWVGTELQDVTRDGPWPSRPRTDRTGREESEEFLSACLSVRSLPWNRSAETAGVGVSTNETRGTFPLRSRP